MTGGLLLLLMLLVSLTSLALHMAALTVLWRQRPRGEAERIASRGYVRTAACRVTAALVYSCAATFQMAGARVNGGDLTPEALIIFTSVQILWLSNALADVAARRRLRNQAEGGGT